MDMDEVRAPEVALLRAYNVLNFFPQYTRLVVLYLFRKVLAHIGFLLDVNALLSTTFSVFVYIISAGKMSTPIHHTPLDYTEYAERAREAVDLINEINRDMPVNLNIPKVVLIGEQGSGKSSLIEILAQVPLPRSINNRKGTRCPIEIHLSGGDEWRCSVFIRNIQGQSQNFDETTDKDVVPLLLSRAQHAAFNFTYQHHLRLNVANPPAYLVPLGSVSRNVVEVKITGAGVDAIFVDLPGLGPVPPQPVRY